MCVQGCHPSAALFGAFAKTPLLFELSGFAARPIGLILIVWMESPLFGLILPAEALERARAPEYPNRVRHIIKIERGRSLLSN